jgi:hypothetical protein
VNERDVPVVVELDAAGVPNEYAATRDAHMDDEAGLAVALGVKWSM